MLYRYAVYKGQDVSVGEETNILSYADADQVSELGDKRLPVGLRRRESSRATTDASLSPQANTTRAEAAAILMRFIEG